MIRNSNLFVKRGVQCGAVLAFLAVGALAQEAEDLRLTVGKSIIIDYPMDVAAIKTSDEKVVDLTLRSTREVLIDAKGIGSATLIIWNKANQLTMYNVNVEMNIDPLRQLIKESFPNLNVQVHSSRDVITITGVVPGKDVADRIGAMAASFSKSVVNNLTTPPAPIERQILLRVKFAELDRSKEVQYGVNLLAGPGGNAIGSQTGQFSNGSFTGTVVVPPSSVGSQTTCTSGGCLTTQSGNNGTFSITQALNLFALDPKLNLGAFIKALQNETILQILAEPNLVTSDGKEANFLVGGQFPVPIVQGGATSGAISVQFKDYGIKLTFLPNITVNNTIAMHLRQEVSTLDLAHAVVLNGFSIPALSTRTAESTVELGEGQSFVVAGLINNQESNELSKVPFISSIPILGSLFKSKDDTVQRQDLIMIVTPEITMPLGPNDQAPNLYMPKDFLKRLEPGDLTQVPKKK